MEKNKTRKLLNVGKIALCSCNFLVYNPSNLISETTSGTVVLDPYSLLVSQNTMCILFAKKWGSVFWLLWWLPETPAQGPTSISSAWVSPNTSSIPDFVCPKYVKASVSATAHTLVVRETRQTGEILKCLWRKRKEKKTLKRIKALKSSHLFLGLRQPCACYEEIWKDSQ